MIRSTPVYIQCKESFTVLDCATGGDNTSGAVVVGAVIDRQALGMQFTHAQALIAASHPGSTSTAGLNRIKLDVVLKHGDSSGGGDLVNFSTDQLPATPQTIGATDRSTDEASWSTGTIRCQYSPEPISLLGAKRFIAAAGQVTRVGGATSTAAGSITTAHLGMNLLNADVEGGPLRNKAIMPAGDYQASSFVLSTATAT